MKNTKKLISAILCGTMLFGSALNVSADAITSTSTTQNGPGYGVALGADLTEDQKQTVLDEMGVSQDKLSDYTVVTVTNADEHQYLDSYLSSDLIGTKAISSCFVKTREDGAGIHVATKNISYCTSEMYENALVTAGLKNADVVVAAPFEVSGTAALVGVSKVYAEMTGTPLNAESVDAAADELVTTQQVAQSTGDADKTSDLIAALKADAVENKDMTEDEMKSKIQEYANQLGISLSDNDIQALITLMQHLAKTNLTTEDIRSQLSNLYKQLKDNGIDTGITDAQATSLIDKISAWLSQVWKSIQNLFNS